MILFLFAAQAAEPAPEETLKPVTIIPRCNPAGGDGEIIVCGRRGGSERYRLPLRPQGFDPKGPIDSVSRERHRLIEEGDAGIGSCSAIGPAGGTGCFHRDTKRRCQQEGCGIAF